jgi:hypothetical protein
MFLEQLDDHRLGNAEQVGVRGIKVLRCRFVDGGEETGRRTPPSTAANAVQQATHRQSFETANMQADSGGVTDTSNPHRQWPKVMYGSPSGRPDPGSD